MPPELGLKRAKFLRDRWSGNFAHSCQPTLLHFDFKENGKQKAVYLHREILRIIGNQSLQVVFKNGNRLDCRRKNLEALTMSEPVSR